VPTPTVTITGRTHPSVEQFFGRAVFSGAELSPNGRFVALRIAEKFNDRRDSLVILDLATMNAKMISFKNHDVGTFHWVNDERLVYESSDTRLAQANFRLINNRIEILAGMFASDRDGKSFRYLFEDRSGPGALIIRAQSSNKDLLQLPWQGHHELRVNTVLLDTVGQQDSNDVFVVTLGNRDFGKHTDVMSTLKRVDTMSGRAETIDTPPHSTLWLFDQDDTLRIAMSQQGKLRAVHYKDPANGKWRKLAEFELLSEQGFEPLAIGPDGTLYVRATNGRDKQAIYRYDLINNRIMPDPVVASNDYDIDGELIFNQRKLLGVRYNIDGEITQWFDADMTAIQKTIDTLLPVTTNRISVARRSETPYVLIDAFSDAHPHTYYLYDTAKKHITELGAAHPDIDPAKMAQKDLVHFTARDGLDIPAYLTVPTGLTKKNLPMVVMVHDGPWQRGGYWKWDSETQFLASRGYVVLEPEYRGSTGFGMRHFKAGWEQWGVSMQNDLADGAKWAIEQGVADPKRICIAGAGYGGYATLMGLVNNPELFRCGIDLAGWTDINLMYTYNRDWENRSNISDVEKQYLFPVLIGTPGKDAAQFKRTSPLEQAANIKQPLLLAYGGVDQIVPQVYGVNFHLAVKDSNPNVEWLPYWDEGHQLDVDEDRFDFWHHVENFLARNIGTP
jgi:dipeptidyl aminopeptidase/acylaminoacyl peptidase